jgi:putative ABC transport system permease protein
MALTTAWPRAARRWIAADLRAHRGQAALTAGIVAVMVAWLVLAGMLLRGANSAWAVLHERTHGADVTIYLAHGTPDPPLSELSGVAEVSPLVPSGQATVVTDTVRAQAELRAMPDAEPAMSAPLVIAGQWLSSARPGGVVVEASLATATHLRPGMHITLARGDGTGVQAVVAGIAQTADQGPYSQSTRGLVWVTHWLLDKVDPSPDEIEQVIGLRLTDRCAICVANAVSEVSSALWSPMQSSPVQPSSALWSLAQPSPVQPPPVLSSPVQSSPVQPPPVQRSVSWQEASAAIEASGWLLGELLTVFGVIVLAAAACAIANVTAARALAQRQASAMLRVIGFTRHQVAGALLAESLLLAVGGAAAGVLLAWATSWLVPAVTRAPGGLAIALAPLPGGLSAVIVGGSVLVVTAATAIQAWRAGRVPPVVAVMARPAHPRVARLARVSLVSRIPAPVILGARIAFGRRAQAALTFAGVAIPMTLITIALACWATIDGFTQDPARISLSAALTAYPSHTGEKSLLAAQAQVKHDPWVSDSYQGAQFQVELPGLTGTYTARAMGTIARPYPFRVTRGTMFAAADQAVASQRLLSLLHKSVGDLVQVNINGLPMIFQVVGQVIDPAGDGDVLDFPVDAMNARWVAAPRWFLSLVLRPGTDPGRAVGRLQAEGYMDVQLVANPAGGLGLVRVVIVVSVIILAAIALASLLTMTRVALRDHLPEARVLAAIGLTSAEVTATFVVAVAILAVSGLLAGTAVGLAAAYWLVNGQAAAIGLGWGIESLLFSPVLVAAQAAVAALAAVAAPAIVIRRCVIAGHPATQGADAARRSPFALRL